MGLKRLISLVAPALLALAALGQLRSLAEAASARLPPHEPAIIYTVNTTSDSPDNNLSDGACHDLLNGKCSLRAAVQQLDHDSGGTINLPADIYPLSDDADGDLQLQKDIHIDGAGQNDTVIQGGPAWAHRILRVQDGAQVFLGDVALSGGHVPTQNGGGLDVVSGTVTLDGVSVINNEAAVGGGIFNGGVLVVLAADITANVALTDGGGIFNAALLGVSPNLTLNSDQLNQNSALSGGGLYNLGLTAVVASTFDGNSAKVGGGIINGGSGTLSLQRSTVSNNIAYADSGGGVYNLGTTALVEAINSTFSGNTARLQGGGLDNEQGTIDLSSVSVVSNTANTADSPSGGGGGLRNFAGNAFVLRDSLVALNQDPHLNGRDCLGQFDSQGYNLVQNLDLCAFGGNPTGNVIGPADPKLSSFGLHGGVTGTWGLQLGSPAIDAGNPAGCRDRHNNILALDQRGATRPADGNGDGVARCDIGAFELILAPRAYLPLMLR